MFGASSQKPWALEDAFEMIAEAGFPMIELVGHHLVMAERAQAVANAGLRVWAVHGTLGNGALSSAADERRQAIDREFRLMEAAAVYAPCPYVIHYLNRFNDPAVGARFRESIETVLDRARSLHLALAIETVPYKPEVNERYPDSREVADFVRSLGSEAAVICVDLNHSNLNERLPEAICNCDGLIATIHVSDNHAFREEHLAPGEGTTDFVEAFRALVQAGYTGAVNMECRPSGGTTLEGLVQLRIWAERMVALMDDLRA
jgi:sugar phosphate isomerase/epimerase